MVEYPGIFVFSFFLSPRNLDSATVLGMTVFHRVIDRVRGAYTTLFLSCLPFVSLMELAPRLHWPRQPIRRDTKAAARGRPKIAARHTNHNAPFLSKFQAYPWVQSLMTQWYFPYLSPFFFTRAEIRNQS